jgi:hypothetical protein
MFKEQLGEEFQVAVIGPGGENLCLTPASTTITAARPGARRGRGDGFQAPQSHRPARTQSVQVADLAGTASGMALFKACKDSDGLKPAGLRHHHRHQLVRRSLRPPTRNFSAGSFEGGPTLYGPVMREQIVITRQRLLWLSFARRQIQPHETYGSTGGRPPIRNIACWSNLGIADIQDVPRPICLATSWH